MDGIGSLLGGIFGLVVIGVLYIYFPIWASRYARARGKDNLAKISIISIFVLLGVLGGLIAWLGSMNSPRTDITLPPCPECGGTNIKMETHTIDPGSGTDLGSPMMLWFNAGSSILIGALMVFLSWGIWTEFLEWVGFSGPVPAMIFAAIGLFTFGRGILAFIGYYRKENKRVVHLTCRSCKHAWDIPVSSGPAV